MKRTIQLLVVTLVMGTAVSSWAQNTATTKKQDTTKAKKTAVTEKKDTTAASKKKQEMNPQEMAQKQTEKMTKDLALTKDQQTKVQAINIKYAQQRCDARAKAKEEGKMTKVEREQAKADFKKNADAQDAEFKNVLTSDQYQKYLKKKEEIKEKMEEKMEERKTDR